MDHPAVADVDADVGYPGAFKGMLEEHQVAGPRLGLADRGAEVVKPSGVEPAYVVAEAAVVHDPRDICTRV